MAGSTSLATYEDEAVVYHSLSHHLIVFPISLIWALCKAQVPLGVAKELPKTPAHCMYVINPILVIGHIFFPAAALCLNIQQYVATASTSCEPNMSSHFGLMTVQVAFLEELHVQELSSQEFFHHGTDAQLEFI